MSIQEVSTKTVVVQPFIAERDVESRQLPLPLMPEALIPETSALNSPKESSEAKRIARVRARSVDSYSSVAISDPGFQANMEEPMRKEEDAVDANLVEGSLYLYLKDRISGLNELQITQFSAPDRKANDLSLDWWFRYGRTLDHEVEAEGRTEVEIDRLIGLTDRKGRYAHSVLFLKLLHDRFLTDVDEWSLDQHGVPREYSNFQLEPDRYVQFVRRFNQKMFALSLPQYFQPDIGV